MGFSLDKTKINKMVEKLIIKTKEYKMNIPEVIYTKLAQLDIRLKELEEKLEYARSVEDTDQVEILEHEFFQIILERLGVDNDEPKLLPDLIEGVDNA